MGLLHAKLANTQRFTAGDLLPWLQITLGFDTSGWSGSFHIAYYPIPLVKPIVWDSRLKGRYQIHWVETDLIAGTWEAETRLLDRDGKPWTVKGPTLYIDPRIA